MIGVIREPTFDLSAESVVVIDLTMLKECYEHRPHRKPADGCASS